MVKSEKIYSPQNYLEAVTGDGYIHGGDDDVAFIERILYENNSELWSYPLSEIDHIVENELNVILVECMTYKENAQE